MILVTYLIAAFAIMVVVRLAASIFSGFVRLFLIIGIACLAGALTLPSMDFTWARDVWATIKYPVYAILVGGFAWSVWTIVDWIRKWAQRNSPPVIRIGKDIYKEPEEWVAEARQGNQWVPVKTGMATQEEAARWAEDKRAEWTRLRGPRKGNMIYQKRIYK